MLYDDNLAVDPGKIISMQVNIVDGKCGSKEELAAEQAIKTITPDNTSKQDVKIGSKVMVALSAPLYDASIGPIVDGIQTFGSGNTRGQWEWQFRPNSPGDLALPLRLALYDSSGEHVLTEWQIVNVHMRVPVTINYVLSSAWAGLTGFFSSLQGLVTSIAGVAACTAGFRAWAVKRAKKSDVNTPPTPVAAGTIGGYL